MNITKNPLRAFLGLTREKNKNIKAWPKKRSSYKKRVYLTFTDTHAGTHMYANAHIRVNDVAKEQYIA